MYFNREKPPSSGSVNKPLLFIIIIITFIIIIGCKKGKVPQLKTEKHLALTATSFLVFITRSDWRETYFDLLSSTTDHALNVLFLNFAGYNFYTSA